MYEMEGALPGRKVARQPVAWPSRHRRPSARARYPRAFPVSRFLLRPRSFLRVAPVSGSKRFLLPRRGPAQGFYWKSSRLFLSTRYPQKTSGYPQAVAVIHRIINNSSTGYRMSPESHQKAIISPVAIGNRPMRLFAPFRRGGPRRSGGRLGLQLPDHGQRVADVLADVGHRVEDVPDRAGAVDHVGHPAGQQAEHGRHPVGLADLAALVAEERERKLVSAREGGVPTRGVGTDPDHVGAGVGEGLVTIAEGARLGRASGGVVLGIEVQHDHVVAQQVEQPDRLPGLGREGEVRRLVAHLNAPCHALPSSRSFPPGTPAASVTRPPLRSGPGEAGNDARMSW